jgi:hypothetical protein
MICGKFFFLLESQAFWDDNFTPEQVFGYLAVNYLFRNYQASITSQHVILHSLLERGKPPYPA